jgi:hypothetical protein
MKTKKVKAIELQKGDVIKVQFTPTRYYTETVRKLDETPKRVNVIFEDGQERRKKDFEYDVIIQETPKAVTDSDYLQLKK